MTAVWHQQEDDSRGQGRSGLGNGLEREVDVAIRLSQAGGESNSPEAHGVAEAVKATGRQHKLASEAERARACQIDEGGPIPALLKDGLLGAPMP